MKRLHGSAKDAAEVAAVALPALAVVHYMSSADDLVKSPTAPNIQTAQTARTLAIASVLAAAIGWHLWIGPIWPRK